MTHFEFISVAVSVVLSLGVIRLLDAIRHAFHSPGRYLVLFLWIIVKLMNHLLFWWALWSYRDFTNWNVLVFSWILLFPGLLYLQVTSLVTTTPHAIADWRAHFYSVRRWFFSANILLILHTAVTISLVRIDASLLPVLVAQSLLLIINIVGVLNAHPKVHIAIVFAALAIQIFGFGTVFFAFGSPVSG